MRLHQLHQSVNYSIDFSAHEICIPVFLVYSRHMSYIEYTIFNRSVTESEVSESKKRAKKFRLLLIGGTLGVLIAGVIAIILVSTGIYLLILIAISPNWLTYNGQTM